MFKFLEKISLENKANFACILSIITFLALFVTMIQLSTTIDSYNRTLAYIEEHKDNIEGNALENLVIKNIDEFTLLSDSVRKYYNLIGDVTGTPTFYIDGKVYKGFNAECVEGMPDDVACSNTVKNAKTIYMFSSPTCGYCSKAEKYLEDESIDYVKICAPIHPGDYDKCKADNTYIY